MHLSCSNHGQRTYLIQPQPRSIESQCWLLLLVVRVCVARIQNTVASFYHFRMVAACIAFHLLAVAVFLQLSNIPTAIE